MRNFLEELEDVIYYPKRWNKWDRIYWFIRFHIWDSLTDLKWQIPNLWQRGQKGWGKADTWNLWAYNAKVMYESLTHLREHKMGYPITIYDEKFPENVNYELNEKTWDNILDKIIYAFKLAKDIGEGNREFYLPLMDEKFQKEQYCLTKEEDEKMNEGFQLYIKYYFSLWD